MVDLWLHARRTAQVGPMGMRGAASLPCAGGWQDQPAALMDAFLMLDGILQAETEGRS